MSSRFDFKKARAIYYAQLDKSDHNPALKPNLWVLHPLHFDQLKADAEFAYSIKAAELPVGDRPKLLGCEVALDTTAAEPALLNETEARERHAKRRRERFPRMISGRHSLQDLADILNAMPVGARCSIDHLTWSDCDWNFLGYESREHALRGKLIGSNYGSFVITVDARTGWVEVERRPEGEAIYDRDGYPIGRATV